MKIERPESLKDQPLEIYKIKIQREMDSSPVQRIYQALRLKHTFRKRDSTMLILSDITDIETSKQLSEERQKTKMLQDITAYVSHQFSSPLQGSFAMLQELITHPSLPVTLRKKVLSLIISQKVCLLYASDLIDEYTLSSNEFKIDKTFVDKRMVCNYIREVILLMHPLAQSKEITVDFDANEVKDPRCSFSVDTNRFQQVLINLLSNAIKFSERDSLVLISIKLDVDPILDVVELNLIVVDHGIGIP